MQDYEKIRREKGIEHAYSQAVKDVVLAEHRAALARQDAEKLEGVFAMLLSALVAEQSVDPALPRVKKLAEELLTTRKMGKLNNAAGGGAPRG